MTPEIPTLCSGFLLGLLGSAHCAGMCGPLALALPGNPRPGPFFVGRLAYNSGRILTYSALGAVFGMFGRTLAMAGFQRWLSISLGLVLLAGLLLSRRAALSRPITWLVTRVKTPMAALLCRRSLSSVALLGVLNGFLPCGLVYVACAAAAATGGLASGSLYMVAFGLGTLPMMLAISLSGKLVPFSLRLRLARAIPFCIVVLAGLLIVRGLSLGIPYLSPDISDPQSCCHR
jgi:sulfite exporter TauE/SafE